MARNSAGVRPTRRSLADLSQVVPNLGTPLDELDHVVVTVAQTVPEQRQAGGAQRILALKDRVWFKVKVGDQRAVVTELSDSERAEDYPQGVGNWWIGAAGHRQADSPQRDFYDSITRECTAGKALSTVGLLPTGWDWKRLTAERAVAWRVEMKRMVIRLIAMSLTSGKVAVAEFQRHRIKALVRADNGHEAYLAIIAEGIPNPEVFALLLDCVPGISPDDWQLEPSQVAELDPSRGEIVWSTLFPREVASAILALDE
ncbi:hypothetical protein [Ruania zhangjianzhongii]|uniref:hypothetical protein n=1 Tax=Ruania zhangjianzhongii TaxID=2603206 RepID=UPI0011C7AC24|nr:hypothetical protein [Ruania zhangjianzhongii]